MKRIRKSQKVYKYSKTQICKCCGKKLPITEFWFKDKETGRRHTKCRDCCLKAKGIIEIGKLRFAKKIFKKNFRRCSVCKDIKPLSKFTKNKNQYGGVSNCCYECSKQLHAEFQKKQRDEIGDWYVRQYAKSRYGLTKLNKAKISKLREEIAEDRKPKYFLDNKEFITVASFAVYVLEKYGMSIDCTCKRINKGYKEKDCIIPESEFRSINSGVFKGKIKVTNTITNEVFIFNKSKDPNLLKMFSQRKILKAIQTKEPTLVGTTSLYKYPCLIERA